MLPTLDSVHEGSLTFPNQSSDVNSSAVDCTWRMKAAQGYVVRLSLDSLNLSMADCHDFVEIYDDPFGTKLEKFCAEHGDQFPRTILSTGPYMAVRFKSANAQKSSFSVRYLQEKQSKHNLMV